MNVENSPAPNEAQRTVLHVGCGPASPERLHRIFRSGQWKEVRVDIDPRVAPDVLASITDLSMMGDASVDAVWCSHNLEHVHSHEVPVALREFRRILKRDGFALILTPDLSVIARFVCDGQEDGVAYESPAGPITPMDMLFGHSASIASGNLYMAHNTGFTVRRLERLILEAGFPRAIVRPGSALDLWGMALMEDTEVEVVDASRL